MGLYLLLLVDRDFSAVGIEMVSTFDKWRLRYTAVYSVTPQPHAGWSFNSHLSMLAEPDSSTASQVNVFASNEAGSNVVVPFHLVVVCP